MNENKTQSIINRSSVKTYALKVSVERRAGKFTRVGESFLQDVEAQVEAAIRGLATAVPYALPAEEGRDFVTGAAVDKLREKLNERARHIIAAKVMRHPTVGVTLLD